MPPHRRIEVFRQGFEGASKDLTERTKPSAWKLVSHERMTDVLKVAVEACSSTLHRLAFDVVRQALPQACCQQREDVELPHMRANIMWVTRLGTLKIGFAFNMDGDTDDDMTLPLKVSGAGEALRSGEATYRDMRKARFTYQQDNLTKYDQVLVRPTLTTLYSIPLKVLNENLPFDAVLNFDSDDNLIPALKRPEVLREINDIAGFVVNAWEELVVDQEITDRGAT
jgi:hypothetical protein